MGSAELHDTKTCPECAEEVKAAAKVCRFCGHRFQDAPADDAVQPDDPLAAYAKKYARAQPSTNVDAPVVRPSWIDRHKVLFGILLTVAAIVVVGVVAVAKGYQRPAPDAAPSLTEKQAAAATALFQANGISYTRVDCTSLPGTCTAVESYYLAGLSDSPAYDLSHPQDDAFCLFGNGGLSAALGPNDCSYQGSDFGPGNPWSAP